MILARLQGRTIYCEAIRVQRRVQVQVKLDGVPLGYLYKRHEVFWMSVAYERAPQWMKAFLDRAHWGSATVDHLRITVTQVLKRALMAELGMACDCGKPATGFALDPDGSQAMTAGDVDERESVPQCHGCQYSRPARRVS